MDKRVRVRDVVEALNTITGGRVCRDASDLFCGKSRFVVT